MKTHLFPVMLTALAICRLPATAQVPVIPSKTAEETRLPVFEDSLQTRELANFRLHLDYQSATATALHFDDTFALPLPAGARQLELTCQQTGSTPTRISVWIDGKSIQSNTPIPGGNGGQTYQSKDTSPRTDHDFTVATSFLSTGDGPLFAKCAPKGPWSNGAKSLFIKGGHLVYDVFGVGAMKGPAVDDGKAHRVVLRSKSGAVDILLDGKPVDKRASLASKDDPSHVFKIGLGADNFTGDLTSGSVSNLRYWARPLDGPEFESLRKGNLDAVNTPDLNWSATETRETFSGLGQPGAAVKLTLKAGKDFKVRKAWIQPLETADHAKLISGWNSKTLAEGKQIYNTLCITCHGDPQKEGSLPTARKFHLEPFKNGSDPYRMFQTLEKGYGMMPPQPQFDAAQKYSVIQYIRETVLRPLNKTQYFEPTADYLASLPKGLDLPAQPRKPDAAEMGNPYEKMDFGPSLTWTFQLNRNDAGEEKNIAQKGIVVRVDSGDGGVSKGKAWMLYDEDTMRVATAYTGGFVDWRGIAFDGSHGTHTSIAGDPLFINPDAPAWENPLKGGWADERLIGRDGRRYGPLPREWLRYLGRYRHGQQTIIHYQVGKAEILELPGQLSNSLPASFTRTLNIAKSPHDLVSRIAPNKDGLAVGIKGPQGITLERKSDGVFLRIPAAATPARLVLGFANMDGAGLSALLPEPVDLGDLTKGGPAEYPQVVTTAGTLGKDSDPFAFDTLTLPDKGDNPWNSWMRLGGFDFFQNNPDRAAVCTWYGDVWLVDGVAGDLKQLKWRRICTGLFQALGLKIVDNTIYVTCRDQIARLHDLNDDDEIDYVECFNNDHQVTEHFHEFAMGLQTDDKGNFYYAKSARHGLPAVVPHHGTLLRVSPEGAKTTIVANGFRAANGVCVNPDGTWIVTDQEGHWNPKNRINYVKEGGFYGNMFGYHDITDTSDAAMEQPLVWITNAMDRSPAELLWVPTDAAWGPLNGSLLNLSYGYGQIYTVPHEIVNGQAQGGMCALPVERAPSGLIRGRFHPANKQLYAVGMVAWATNCATDGGFYRIRATGKPGYMPIKTEARKGTYTITFSDPLPTEGTFKVTVWNLKRTANYGSKHYDEHELKITNSVLNENQVTLSIPDLAPTWGMEISCDFGSGIKRVIHASIHQLP